MAFKRYVTNCSGGYTTYLTLPNKKELKVDFNGKDIVTKERFIDVQDPMVQQALEASVKFGLYYTLAEYSVEEQTAPSEDSEVVKTFRNMVEARDWVNHTYGILQTKMPNKLAVVEQAKILGFSIKFLTD